MSSMFLDRMAFGSMLEELASKTGWKSYAWVLVDNHCHLAFMTPGAKLVAGMIWVSVSEGLEELRIREEGRMEKSHACSRRSQAHYGFHGLNPAPLADGSHRSREPLGATLGRTRIRWRETTSSGQETCAIPVKTY